LICTVVLVATAALVAPQGATGTSTTWTFTDDQRRAYLAYYAPVLMQRGDENNSQAGWDWVSNYDFDQDGNFSNNRTTWRTVHQLVAANGAPGPFAGWRLRPTIYTSLIEFTEGGSKSLVLLYHVYHAIDKDGDEIHDWERVEIVLRGVTGTPGGPGEAFANSTVTHHKDHVMRRATDPDVQFMQTATGRHLLLWQADLSDFDLPSAGPHAHELRYMTNPWSWLAGQLATPGANAKVNISGADDKRRVHYVFVPEGSSAAVSTWQAQPLTYGTASSLAARKDNGDTVSWQQVKRIRYELQDMADIVPTHWAGGPWATNWLADLSRDIALESPVRDEAGAAVVPVGMQRFYLRTRDSAASDLTDGREGVPAKSWFWGAYSAELDEDTPSGSDDFGGFEGLGLDSAGRSRGAASGDPASHGVYWRQHDFFVHSGGIDDAERREVGNWLVGTWYTPTAGGFDGRWAQLFDDRPGAEPH
jgi:hypothetical protein